MKIFIFFLLSIFSYSCSLPTKDQTATPFQKLEKLQTDSTDSIVKVEITEAEEKVIQERLAKEKKEAEDLKKAIAEKDRAIRLFKIFLISPDTEQQKSILEEIFKNGITFDIGMFVAGYKSQLDKKDQSIKDFFIKLLLEKSKISNIHWIRYLEIISPNEIIKSPKVIEILESSHLGDLFSLVESLDEKYSFYDIGGNQISITAPAKDPFKKLVVDTWFKRAKK